MIFPISQPACRPPFYFYFIFIFVIFFCLWWKKVFKPWKKLFQRVNVMPRSKNPFAGLNIQLPEGEIFFLILIATVICSISTVLKQKKSPILRPLIFAPGASAPGAPPPRYGPGHFNVTGRGGILNLCDVIYEWSLISKDWFANKFQDYTLLSVKFNLNLFTLNQRYFVPNFTTSRKTEQNIF